MRTFTALVAAVLVLIFSVPAFCVAPATAEELIARHLESIGPKDARAKVAGIGGAAEIAYDSLSTKDAHGEGTAKLVSRAGEFKYASKFPLLTYQGEILMMVGGKTDVRNAGQQNSFSYLARYLYLHPILMKEGIFGGVLNTGWPLENVAKTKAKLQLNGLKKFNNAQAYELIYTPKKNETDTTIKLYFDPDTLRHIGTITEFQAQTAVGVDMQKTSQRLTEIFSDFTTVNGVAVPQTWDVRVEDDTPANATVTSGAFGRAIDIADTNKTINCHWVIKFPQVIVELAK